MTYSRSNVDPGLEWMQHRSSSLNFAGYSEKAFEEKPPDAELLLEAVGGCFARQSVGELSKEKSRGLPKGSSFPNELRQCKRRTALMILSKKWFLNL